MDGELRTYFPEKFTENETIEFYYQLKKRIEADLQALKDPELEAAAVEVRTQTNEYFAMLNKPKDFSNNINGFTIQMENSFEELVCVLEDNGTIDAKSLTTYEFITRTEYCERKFKAQTK